jgi:prefoldin subunit 5
MILINLSPKAAARRKEAKRKAGIRPVILLVWLLCLMGLSVSATYFIVHGKYHSQLARDNEEILTGGKERKALADQNIELRNSLQKLENGYSDLERQFRELASKVDGAENAQRTSELSSVSKDLERAKADINKLRDELESKLSEIETLNAARQSLEQKYADFKKILGPYLVLEPTWVGPGETTQAFDGNLLIVLYEPSGKDVCLKDTAAVSYLTKGSDKKKLCLRTGKPENFIYQGRKYQFVLLASKANERAVRYCIYILK